MRAVLVALMLGCAALAGASEMSVPAPDFTLKSRSGENIRLSELRGNVVMVNFWASWCGPCRQEMPLLDDLYQEYRDYGFELLGINVDENQADAERMLERIPVSFPVLFDPESTVSKEYGVDAMPSTLLIDRDGNARYLHRGYRPGEEEIYAEKLRALVLE
jgi:peroxiredoxin